jgi:hypothetical protein
MKGRHDVMPEFRQQQRLLYRAGTKKQSVRQLTVAKHLPIQFLHEQSFEGALPLVRSATGTEPRMIFGCDKTADVAGCRVRSCACRVARRTPNSGVQRPRSGDQAFDRHEQVSRGRHEPQAPAKSNVCQTP